MNNLHAFQNFLYFILCKNVHNIIHTGRSHGQCDKSAYLISDQEIVRDLKLHSILYLAFFKILKLLFYIPYFQCGYHCLFSKSINYTCPLGSYVVKNIDDNKVWIGVTDSTEEGTWTWVNRTMVISG